MKYIFELSSRISEKKSLLDKHNKVIGYLSNIKGEWGLQSDIKFEVPKFGTGNITAFFNLTKKVGKNIRGDIMYRYRNMLSDHHSCDDRIYLEFNAKKVDFKSLIDDEFYRFIEGFESYTAAIYPEELIFYDKGLPFEVRSKLNFRYSIGWFYPFYFIDSELVKRALGYTVKDLFNLLNGKVYHVELFNNGILLKASDNYITLDEAIGFNKKIVDVLKIQLPMQKVFPSHP